MAYMTITDKEVASALKLAPETTAPKLAEKLKVTTRRAAKILLRAGFKVKKQGGAGVATLYAKRK